MKTELRNGTQKQMQLVLPAPATRLRRSPGRPCPPARARWWFEQMRRVVDDAPHADGSGSPTATA